MIYNTVFAIIGSSLAAFLASAALKGGKMTF